MDHLIILEVFSVEFSDTFSMIGTQFCPTILLERADAKSLGKAFIDFWVLARIDLSAQFFVSWAYHKTVQIGSFMNARQTNHILTGMTCALCTRRR